MELVFAALPFLAFLACPLMMVSCLFSMRKMGCATPPLSTTQQEPKRAAERMAALQQQLTAIQAELTTLQNDKVQAPGAALRGAENQMIDAARRTAHATRRPA